MANAGSWVGAAGTNPQDAALTADAPVETASIAKTITPAEILRLVEEGALRLDDQASSHLSPGKIGSTLAQFCPKCRAITEGKAEKLATGLLDLPRPTPTKAASANAAAKAPAKKSA